MISYDTLMKPLEKTLLGDIRKTLISQAKGDVLEIGFGTGVNMPLYNFDAINSLNGLDLKITTEQINQFPSINLHEGSASSLPFPDKSMETILATLVMCSVDDLIGYIQEIHRVLKDDGIYIFMEHVLPKNKVLKVLFKSINKPWHAMSTCNLIRNTDEIFINNGFKFLSLNQKGLGIFKYGIAVKEISHKE